MKNLKIGTRLGLGFCTLLLLMLAITGVGVLQVTVLSKQISFVTDVGDVRIEMLNNVQSAINQRAIAARNLALVDDPEFQKADIELVKVSQIKIDQGLAKLATLLSNPETSSAEARAMLAKLRALEARYMPVAVNIVELVTTQKSYDAIQVIKRDCMPLLIQITENVLAFEKLLNTEATANADSAQSSAQNAKWILLIMSAISLLVGAVLGWRLVTSITRPLTDPSMWRSVSLPAT